MSPKIRPERASAADARELEGPALSCREYPRVQAKIRGRDLTAHFPRGMNVGGQAAIVYNFCCPAPRSLPASGFTSRWNGTKE